MLKKPASREADGPDESPVLAQRAVSEEQEGSSQTILLARRTRTIKQCSSDARREGQSGCSPDDEVGKIGRPSPGVLARLGVPVGGRVRTLRAVGDSSGPSQGEIDEQAWNNHL